MPDIQDMVQQRLESLNDLFRKIEQNGLAFEIFKTGKLKDQYGENLSKFLAVVEAIGDGMDFPEVHEILKGVRDYNQLIDGYRIDKAIEAQLAEDTISEAKEKK